MKTEISSKIKDEKIGKFFLSPGHFHFFLNDEDAHKKIKNDLQTLEKHGLLCYLKQEYPTHFKKSIIINQIGESEKFYIVDGNRHIFTLALFDENLTLFDILECYPSCLRFWKNGFEDDSQASPFKVYIPMLVDTSKLPNTDIVSDFSKNPPSETKRISATVEFDDGTCFTPQDRGRTISLASSFFKRKNANII